MSTQDIARSQPEADAGAERDLDDASLYFNRELSWVDFNDRVLQLAEDARVPLMERVKFAAIYTSNLDEFFMVRVAGLQDQVDAGITTAGPDGLTPSEVVEGIGERVAAQSQRLCRCVEHDLIPALAEHGVRIVSWDHVSDDERAALSERFQRQIFPVLTPLAVGLGRPFPYISNLSLSLAVRLRDPMTEARTFARVKVPKEMLPRFVPVAEGAATFVPLEDVIAHHLDQLFPGMEILDYDTFRVTRDADFTVSDEADDLLQAVEAELRRRRFGEVVRVEVGNQMNASLREELTDALGVEEGEVYSVAGPLDLNDLWQIAKLPGFADLRYEPWSPVTQPRLQTGDEDQPVDIFGEMRRDDILVHHPYDSFATSVEAFVEQAVEDPDVLAIKQTVYRTSDDSPLVPALIRATERGKQAVCLVELKARFDERANIQWARALEEAGVHVVYGHPALKTHAKCVLVVRREGDGVRHYVHVGTGNYHPTTARLYTDFGLFTCDEEIGADVADMFNFLTGYGRPRRYRKVLVAPNFLRDGILAQIEKTIEAHSPEHPSRIAMKMNALVDRKCIKALYRASQAGVKVDLNIRGICCLRPGVEGVSENIRVVSVVGRFLEHSRIFAFERAGEEPRVYIGSADLMPRNLDTRVELDAPVEDPPLRDDLLDAIERCLADDANAWDMRSDGDVGASREHRRRAAQRLSRAHARARLPRRRGGRPRRVTSPREAIEPVHIKVPTRGNRRLERLLSAVNSDAQVKAWWRMQGLNADRLHMSDHSWVHIQIVVNIALRMARLLFRRGVEPVMVSDHSMTERDAEVVIAAAAPAARHGHAGPPDRPRGLLAVPGRRQAAGAARGRLRGPRAHDRRGRGAARDHRPPPPGRPVHDRGGRSCGWPTRSTWPAGARACPSRPATRTSTRSRRMRSRTSRSWPGARRRCGWRSRCPTAPGSSRSTSCWPPSCAGAASRTHVEVVARVEAEQEQRLVQVFRL